MTKSGLSNLFTIILFMRVLSETQKL